MKKYRKALAGLLVAIGAFLIYKSLYLPDIDVKKGEVIVNTFKEGNGQKTPNLTPEEALKEVGLTEEEIKEVNGVLEIPKINLFLPIKHGAVHENMLYSVATMTHRQAGEGLNYTIAGHRNIKRGKNFNRLNEVEIGDEVYVYQKDGVYKYVIDDKFITEPYNINILKDGRGEITMITCYPISVSTHRLTLKGELVDIIN